MTERGARLGSTVLREGKAVPLASVTLLYKQLRADPGTGQVWQLPVLPGVAEAPAGSLLQDCFDSGKATVVHEKMN